MIAYRGIGCDHLRRFPEFSAPQSGEVWIELDPRRPVETRLVEITGPCDVYTGKVPIKHLTTGKVGYAQRKRFNGHKGGYAPKAWFDITYPTPSRRA